MNAIFKSLFWVVAAGAAVFFGLQMKQGKELDKLKESEAAALGELAEATKKLELLRAKLELEKAGSKTGEAFEAKHLQSGSMIAAERKRIAEIRTKWSEIESNRVAAVTAVREKEPTRKPEALTLADGTKLNNCVIRSVDEKIVSIEHMGGVGKIPVGNLPGDVKTRLGLGWRVDPPAVLDVDAKGNVIAGQAPQLDGGDGSMDPLNLDALDMSNLAAIVKSLALVETHLLKTTKAMENESAAARKHAIFKPDMVAEGTGKTYRELKAECNQRQANLSSRVEALKTARGKLQQKLKSS